MRERMEKHSGLHQHFNFQIHTGNSSLVVTLIYEQLGVHINIVPLCPLLCNQGGLTPKVPNLKPENHLSSSHVISLFMPLRNTYLANTCYMPCTRLDIKNIVVREIVPGNRPLGTYSLDSRGKNNH